MGSLNIIRLFRSDRISTLINGSYNWYHKKVFSDIFKNEISRSYRTGKPLSIVIIDFSSYPKIIPTITDKHIFRFLKEVVSVISQYSRNCDIKSIQNRTKINIVLINTSIEGSKIYIEMISQRINEHLIKINNPRYFEMFKSMSFAFYPLNKIAGNKEITATPAINESADSTLPDKEMQIPIAIRKMESLQLNWNMEFSADGTISIAAPYILDNLDLRELFEKHIKRAIDICGALAGIIIFSLVSIFIACAIKLNSPGPVIFKQKRVGLAGKPFNFFKFRTMRSDCDDKIHREYVKNLIKGNLDQINNGSKENPVFKIVNDPRVTKVGNILRKTSLDELPQFLNVLKGEMSLVGPRPPIPYEVNSYKNWHLQRIMEAKPGITGLWQVCGRSQTTFDEMVRYDLQYVRNRSFFLDLKILLKTFGAVLNSRGAM